MLANVHNRISKGAELFVSRGQSSLLGLLRREKCAKRNFLDLKNRRSCSGAYRSVLMYVRMANGQDRRFLRLKNDGNSPTLTKATWGMALLEYCFMVPANKIGFHENGGPFSLFQLKVIQEVISLTIFTVIAMFIFQGEKLQWNHIASFICLMAAVVFAFLPTK